jgi:hypothetical protein
VRLRAVRGAAADARAEFMQAHPEHIAPNNALRFVSDDGGASYNLCHCVCPVSSACVPR